MARRGLAIGELRVARGGRQVLHGVSLAMDRGEIAALLGANGAGKSTLVMAVAGALPVLGGTVRLDGADLRGFAPDAVRRRGIAVVAEGHRVLGTLSVLDNLRAAGSALRRAALGEAVAQALALFPELEPRLRLAADNLSGGQKQMVAIAQALIGRPEFLLVDELSFGLAPAVVVRLGETLRQIAARGVGVLLIEQFTTLALALADSAHVMERGRLVFSGAPEGLRQRPEVLHSAYLAAPPRAADREETPNASTHG